MKLEIFKSPFQFISLNHGSNFSTDYLNILDDDVYPYSNFKCNIENDKTFIVFNDVEKKKVKQFECLIKFVKIFLYFPI
jgi:hypothetical protein